MYQQWSPRNRGGNRLRKSQIELRAKRRLQQFCLSLGLFSLVFVGQGIFPTQVAETSALIRLHFNGETDFRSAFQNLGQALAEAPFQVQNLETFCIEVFGGATELEEEAVMVLQPMVEYVPPLDYFSMTWRDAVEVMAQVEHEEQEAEEEPKMAVGTVLASYDSSDLPESHTFDYLYLGERETVSPVELAVTSEYGMRIGPLTGDLAMHRGVDLVASVGAEIVSWSDGVVEAVGETAEVGFYVRVDHGDGIKSFYAHCSEILVEEGQAVAVGEVIALAGDTGRVTGPHLHFELSWNGEYVNPLHYLD